MLGETVGGLRLAEDWRAIILDAAGALADNAQAAQARRAVLEQKGARLRHLLIEGLIEEADYRAERARLEAELAELAPPPQVMDLEEAAALLANLNALWQGATPEERKALAGQVVSAIYVDPDHPEEMGILLTPAVQPLMAALPECINWVIDGARVPMYYLSSMAEINEVAA